jgi:hypothetical protein
MRLPHKTICIFLLICIVLCLRMQAQSTTQDTSHSLSAYGLALRQYHDYLDPEPNLYRGGQYAEYGFLIKDGHPFFGEDRSRIGTVVYNGILYENIPLLFDEVYDNLVTTDPIKVFKITLIPYQVDRFTIEDHSFVRLSDSLNRSQPSNGFYEQLYKGHISLLRRERKVVQEDISNQAEGIRRYIEVRVSFYVRRGDEYYPVNNKSSLLVALKDKSKEARKFIRQNHLNFRKDKENVLVKVVAWYDKLNP